MSSSSIQSNKKRTKLSQDYVEDSDDQESHDDSSLSLSSSQPQKNEENEPFFEISDKRRVTVRRWKGSILIDIREFWGEGKPGKKGILI